MARKQRKQASATLPQRADEVWEVGRRPLDVSVEAFDLEQAQPELILVIQVNEPGGVVLGQPLASDEPLAMLADVVQQAMQWPLFGVPRRPGVVRVSSQAEADVLRDMLVPAGIALEVADRLDAIDAVHIQMVEMLGGMASDYRTRAAQEGESLSEGGLRALFRTAQHFYRRALWEIYDDTAIFTFSFQAPDGPNKTLYGVLMGSMGQELGLALYTSFEDIEQFYSEDAEDDPFFQDLGPGDPSDIAWQDDEDDMASPLLSIPCTSLTFEHQEDLPAPLLEEAQQLSLPIANHTAFPLFACTGETGMRVAPPAALADMSVVLEAILAWDEHIEKIDLDDEIDETVSVQLPAIEAFRPALSVQVTLIDNPFVIEEEDDFDDDLPSLDVHALLESMQSPLVDLDVPAPRRRVSPQPPIAPQEAGADSKTVKVYTVKVYLTNGPISEAYANREISRQIHILGNQSLHDLHLAIFDAFERWEEHLYEFNLGAGAHDRSRIYCYQGGWTMDRDVGDPEATTLEGLHLDMGQRFGYTFDLGDQWEHVIEVIAIKDDVGSGTYPRLGKKVGAAPPQYDDDLDDDVEDDDL